MRRTLFIAAAAAFLTACSEEQPDAYGTFEAVETVISPETPGRLIIIALVEGTRVAAGDVLAVVDTGQLALQRGELDARRATIMARMVEADAQLGVLDVQLGIARREYGRTARLTESGAATTQQMDRATRDLETLDAQKQAAQAARSAVSKELGTIDAQMAVLADRIRRSTIVAPVTGSILARYVEHGELVQPGTPIARIASLDTLTFRAWVAENQLSMVRTGDNITVQVDAPGGTLRAVQGQVRWISAKAEFTPTPIQTREERVTQVYAVKVAVPNPDGSLKIGMPGELVITAHSK